MTCDFCDEPLNVNKAFIVITPSNERAFVCTLGCLHRYAVESMEMIMRGIERQ